MSRFEGVEKVGLRNKETNRVVAVFPHRPEGTDREIEDKVKFWFYQQSCGAEDELVHLYVDRVSPEEAKPFGH